MERVRRGWGGCLWRGRTPGSHTMTISPAPALQLTSDSKTFWRVEEELSWSEALEYCRQRHTDLAELQSTGRLEQHQDPLFP